MKLKTSFFNAAVYRKNLTRFAPAWALYGIFLLMILLVLLSSGVNSLDTELVYMLPPFAVANFLFALLTAQLLFGDLYNTRMCNALHALPMRREGWFLTNLASGMTFSLIPTLAALVLSLLTTTLMGSRCVNGPLVPVFVFLGANLQYLFFFGLATLCAFLVGNRFAMALVYGIFNFASYIAYWLVDTLYTPMLYGLKTVEEPFLLLCPVAQLAECEYMGMEYAYPVIEGQTREVRTMVLSDGWGYLAICAALGLVLLGLALLLYRKRKLECAGDFMSVKGAEPVFLVVYTLVMGAFFQLFFDVFSGSGGIFFLLIGLVVGFFTGRMLLKRTVRVFQGKAWLGCGALIVCFALTLGITALDPFGIQRWVPDAQEVKSVTVASNHGTYRALGDSFNVNAPEDIEAMIGVHRAVLNGEEDVPMENGQTDIVIVESKSTVLKYNTYPICLEYHMKNGTTVRRYYYVWTESDSGKLLREYFSSVECILGVSADQLPQLAQRMYFVNMDGTEIILDSEVLSLLEAMAADCEAGSMIQLWAYRNSVPETETVMYIGLQERVSANVYTWNNLEIYEDCENTIRWMQEHGISTLQEKYK